MRSDPLGIRDAAPAEQRRGGAVLVACCAGMFLVLLDATVVNVAVPSIITGLGTTTAGAQWVVDGYTLALACLLLAGGALGDRFGHRRLVLGGLLIFAAASIGCAAAPNLAVLVGARVAQGAAAAAMLSASLALITASLPDPPLRTRALGIWAGVSSLALPAGPLLGGVLVQTLGWRAVFWINPPIVAGCLLAVALVVPRDTAPTQRRTLDLGGLSCVVAIAAALVYAVVAGGAGDWLAAVPCALVITTALIILARVERRARDPLLPTVLRRDRGFLGANCAAFTMNLTSNGTLFLVTRYLQQVRGHGPLAAGGLLVPLFLPLAVLSPLAGRLAARRGASEVMIIAALIAATGQAALMAITPVAGYPRLMVALIGIGLGIALFTAPVVATALRAAPPGQAGVASGVNNTARQLGTALGVALYGSIAGAPADAGHFTGALRLLGLAAAVSWLAVAVVLLPARGAGPAHLWRQADRGPGPDRLTWPRARLIRPRRRTADPLIRRWRWPWTRIG